MGALYPLRVAETTTTTGTGTLTLAGVPNAAYRSFAAQLGAGASRVRYVIEWDGGFELGIGAFNGTDQMTRAKVIRSSNADAIVSLPPGAKTVFAWSTTAEPELGFTAALSADDVMLLDGGQGLFTGATPATQPLPAVATLPAGFMASFRNAGTAALTLDPDASETINGATTLVLAAGQRATLYRRPGGWEAVGPVATQADLAALSAAALRRDGSVAMTGDLDLDGNRVTGLDAAVDPADAVPLTQAQALVAAGTQRILVMRDERAANTAGVAFDAAWTRRALNVKQHDGIGVGALSSDRFTLPAGTYELVANSWAYAGGARLRLWNVTDAATVLVGRHGFTNSGGSYDSSSCGLHGVFVIAAEKQMEIQGRRVNGSASQPASNLSEPEIYLEVVVRKVA